MTTLKSQLASLLQLQEFDSQIYKLTEEKDALPAEIEKLRSAFEEKKKAVAAADKAYLDAQKEKKDSELDLAGKEEAVKKLQSQLYSLKTNQEYNTMLRQIQDAKADASVIEDKILEAMEKIEKCKADLEIEKQKLAEEEKTFSADKKKFDDRIKELSDKIAVTQNQRNQMAPSIEKRVLAQYERVLHSRQGLAICPVINNTCSGCHLAVPPQTVNLIQMYENIVTCEACNRILILPDEQA